MIYYALVLLIDTMFGTQFFFTKRYQRQMGSGLRATLLYAVFGFGFTALIMLVLKSILSVWGGITPFGILMGCIMGVSNLIQIVCAVRAMEYVNLSMYSVYVMLGGMLLPTLFGIIGYREPITLGKILCFVLITISLLFSLEGKTKNKKAYIYYAALFVLNGMSGVFSKFHEENEQALHSLDLMLLISLVVCLLGAIFLLFLSAKEKTEKSARLTPPALFSCFGYGTMNGVAQMLCFVTLSHIEASVQYPLITGGVMVVSTLIGFLCGEKPTLRNLLSVAAAFASVVCLIF